MAIQMGKALAFAAVGGMVAGLGGCGGADAQGAAAPAVTGVAPAHKHDCKGKNECKGQGGCKTERNSCKGQNSCKGLGGCRVVL